MKVCLSNFRAFAETGLIEIKPLTILVGENSTGKTSFLAALRYCFSLQERSKGGYFNSPPFDLGSYEDIVHHSGHHSTDLRFSLTIDKRVDINRDGSLILDPKAKSYVRDCSLKVIFRSRFGDVSISSFQFSFDDIEMEYRVGNKGGVSYKRNGIEIGGSDKQSDLGLEDSNDYRAEDLRQISYKLFDRFYGSRQEKSSKAERDVIILVAHAFDAFISSEYILHTSPPVRSVPRRVYTSSDEGGFSDQTHAPHELNRLKRADRRRWTRLNASLNQFGKLSGLFTRFDITKLTRQDSGPFQLKVTVRGRSSNIVDVGYGVSQSLPIITDLIEAFSDRSVFLLQQPEVHLHPKAQAALGSFFSQHITRNTKSFIIAETHSDYLIDRIRIEVKRGGIDPQLVSILYFEPLEGDVHIHEISIDKLGNICNAPASYRHFFISEQENVLGL